MFLDAFLGLALWGPLLVLFIFLLLFITVTTLIKAGIRLRKEGPSLPLLLLLLASTGILVGITTVCFYVLSDHRTYKQVVVDLRKPPNLVLTELKRNCASGSDNNYCDSARYKLEATIIFPGNLQLSTPASDINWSENEDGAFDYISIRDSTALSLQAGQALLLKHTSTFSDATDIETQNNIKAAEKWISYCCKNNTIYSEVHSIQLRPSLRLEFRKNIDQIDITYSITPSSNHAAN